MTTYTKLKNGSWGLRSTDRIEAGQLVTVAKKAGTPKAETVGRILWTGNGVTLAMIAGASHYTDRTTGHRVKTGRDDRTCLTCGHTERRNARGYVDGDWVRGGECQSCREERQMGY